MKLIFRYTDHPDLVNLSKADIYNTSIEIPDEGLYLIGCRERVLGIGQLIGLFTNSCLFITCKEVDLSDYPLKLVEVDPSHHLHRYISTAVLYFERLYSRAQQRRQLKIYAPIAPMVPQSYLFRRGGNQRERNSLTNNLLQLGDYWCKTDLERAYAQNLENLAQHLLVLLNAQPVTNQAFSWQCRGFHPRWQDDALVDRHNERIKQQMAQLRKQQKIEARQKQREEKLRAAGIKIPEVLQSGAGRRPGARPGIFKGVQMRSQLEIRFAAELEERGIRWVYEGAVLGEGGYLVDFYLPDLACWVEVKGRFEARDKILLKEVSADLKRERHERIFVYGQSRAWVVNPSGFREIMHDQFWSLIYKT
jgi:hypothetical protein